MSVLQEAEAIVNGARQAAYGPPENCFARIATLWSAYLDSPLTASDIARMMILLKVARSMGSPYNRDTAVDIAGYAACYAMVEGDR